MTAPSFSWMKRIAEVRAALAADPARGFQLLHDALRTNPALGFEIELIGRMIRQIPSGGIPERRSYRVAVVSSFTSEPLANAVAYSLAREGIVAEVYEAPFGSMSQEILDSSSGLYRFRPDAVLIAAGSETLSFPAAGASAAEVAELVEDEIRAWESRWDTLASRSGVAVIQHLFELPDLERLGIVERRAPWSPASFIGKLDERLLEAAGAGVRWLDVDVLAARVGRENWRDLRMQHHGKFGFAVRYLPEYCDLLIASLREPLGRTRKALIVDLDNTLWGGIIGDDRIDGIQLGPESAEGSAYEAFGRYVKELGQRGVILGICSKNDMSSVEEVFEKHPHMPLALADFAVVVCNWGDKATNLSEIARQLNIDVSALVFADDNPAECDLIRQALPEVHTILLAGDPALFARQIDRLHLFDQQLLSREDLSRSASYQARKKSQALAADAPDLASYLASLEMKGRVRDAAEHDLARLAQMEAKTNQFNLSTRRLSLERLREMSLDGNTVVLAVELSDRFANHGLVAYLAARFERGRMVITDWLMSCRVFSRTLEEFVFNHLVERAGARDVSVIEATLTPTAKNSVMNGLFERLGFECAGHPPEGPWEFKISHPSPLRCFVEEGSNAESGAEAGAV